MYQYKCYIKRIVDGDTVDVDIDLGFDTWIVDQRIRLYDIDAPESRTSDRVEEHFGELAEQYVASYLIVGNEYLLTSREYDAERGKYGRILGDFEVYDSEADIWVSLVMKMIRDNHAVPYNTNKDAMRQQHLLNRKRLIESGNSNMTLEEAGVL